jgi:hypothetical protein
VAEDASDAPGEHGEFTHDPEEEVPVEDWFQWPVSDSSDYLDRADPVYGEPPA